MCAVDCFVSSSLMVVRLLSGKLVERQLISGWLVLAWGWLFCVIVAGGGEDNSGIFGDSAAHSRMVDGEAGLIVLHWRCPGVVVVGSTIRDSWWGEAPHFGRLVDVRGWLFCVIAVYADAGHFGIPG
jgi:hypothetical protein